VILCLTARRQLVKNRVGLDASRTPEFFGVTLVTGLFFRTAAAFAGVERCLTRQRNIDLFEL
jgi:hypothetical protein